MNILHALGWLILALLVITPPLEALMLKIDGEEIRDGLKEVLFASSLVALAVFLIQL